MSKYQNNEVTPVAHQSRTAELVLGITGGIFGIIAGLLAMTIGGIGSALETSGSAGVSNLGVGCIIVSVLAIILSVMINRNHVLMGWLIILCGILNFVFVSFFGILSGLLIVIAGGLALRK